MSGHIWNQIHTSNSIQTECVVFIYLGINKHTYICVFVFIYAHVTTIKEKDAKTWDVWEGWRKERREGNGGTIF